MCLVYDSKRSEDNKDGLLFFLFKSACQLRICNGTRPAKRALGRPRTNVPTSHPANADGELNTGDELGLSKRALPEISHNFNQESVEGEDGVIHE